MRAYPSVASANWSLWLALPSMLAGCPHPSSLMPVGLPHASKQSANSILRIRILWNHFSSLLRDLIDFAIMRHNTTHLSATPLLLFTSLIFSCLHFFCLVLSCHVLSCLVLSFSLSTTLLYFTIFLNQVMAISMFCLCCEQMYLRMWKKRTDWQEISPQQQLVWEAPALGSMVSPAHRLVDVKHYIEERLTFPFSTSLFLQISLSYSLLVLHSDARVSITDTHTHTMNDPLYHYECIIHTVNLPCNNHIHYRNHKNNGNHD